MKSNIENDSSWHEKPAVLNLRLEVRATQGFQGCIRAVEAWIQEKHMRAGGWKAELLGSFSWPQNPDFLFWRFNSINCL